MTHSEGCSGYRIGSERWIILKGKRFLWGVLVVISGLASAPTHAQDALTIADVHCVIVGMELSATADSASRSRGVFLALYYTGRLDGRTPKFDFENLLIEETNKMSGTEYASEMKRCGAELAAKGLKMTQIGKDMTQRKAKMPTLPTGPAK